MAWEEDWASLEPGLLHDVFLRLELDADAAHFRSVCRQWRAAVAGTNPDFVPRPWLVVYEPHNRRYALLRPSRRRRERRFKGFDTKMALELEDSPAARLISASRGWAAVKLGDRLLLKDPISGAEVPLPPCGPEYRLAEVFLPDDPLTVSGAWTAFAIMSHHQDIWTHELRVAFCRAGDGEWTFLDDVYPDYRQLYMGLEFFRGQAYVLLSSRSKVVVCDVASRRLVDTAVDLFHPLSPNARVKVSCLVSCGDDLLFVDVVQHPEEFWRSCFAFLHGGHSRYTARVYKVEFAADGSGVPVGSTKVESIGDYALFVSLDCHAFALPARGFPGVEPNRVYHLVKGEEEILISVPWETRRLKPVPLDDLPELPMPVPLEDDLEEDDVPLEDDLEDYLLVPIMRWNAVYWFCPRRPVLDKTMVVDG